MTLTWTGNPLSDLPHFVFWIFMTRKSLIHKYERRIVLQWLSHLYYIQIVLDLQKWSWARHSFISQLTSCLDLRSVMRWKISTGIPALRTHVHVPFVDIVSSVQMNSDLHYCILKLCKILYMRKRWSKNRMTSNQWVWYKMFAKEVAKSLCLNIQQNFSKHAAFLN